MELFHFHFLSAGLHVTNYASEMLRKNLKDIKDLILNKRFTPFPSSKIFQLDDKSNSLKNFDVLQQRRFVRYYYSSVIIVITLHKYMYIYFFLISSKNHFPFPKKRHI